MQKKKGPNCGWIKDKKTGLYFQNKTWYSTFVGLKIVVKHDLNRENTPESPTNSPDVPKKGKNTPQREPNKKQKIMLYFQNQS